MTNLQQFSAKFAVIDVMYEFTKSEVTQRAQRGQHFYLQSCVNKTEVFTVQNCEKQARVGDASVMSAERLPKRTAQQSSKRHFPSGQ